MMEQTGRKHDRTAWNNDRTNMKKKDGSNNLKQDGHNSINGS